MREYYSTTQYRRGDIVVFVLEKMFIQILVIIFNCAFSEVRMEEDLNEDHQ